MIQFVHWKASHILNQRRFHGVDIVAFLHDRAGQSRHFQPLLLQCLRGQIAPSARDNAKTFRVGANKQRLENAAFANARQDVAEVRLLGLMPHIGRRDVQVRQGYMTQFHR